ncbi:hypothetical protein EBZ80_22085 [bacterium]|nr:hypothetical protein [bacterium]
MAESGFRDRCLQTISQGIGTTADSLVLELKQDSVYPFLFSFSAHTLTKVDKIRLVSERVEIFSALIVDGGLTKEEFNQKKMELKNFIQEIRIKKTHPVSIMVSGILMKTSTGGSKILSLKQHQSQQRQPQQRVSISALLPKTSLNARALTAVLQCLDPVPEMVKDRIATYLENPTQDHLRAIIQQIINPVF